ncbi:hypothetical protein AVEN_6330-1 [Araneus ventricosus]|uniref:Uncharacterized protein n=1 Tax=Araneus ventricosus TaxID=182803 RepID=A0A4Y2SBZ9_ARAVE|nr:hypothetical protein AVEN_6330-1 [Araneus ventricosus]
MLCTLFTEHTTSRLAESGLTPAARLQRSLDQRARNRLPGHFHPSPIWNTAGTPGLHFPPYGTPYTANVWASHASLFLKFRAGKLRVVVSFCAWIINNGMCNISLSQLYN